MRPPQPLVSPRPGFSDLPGLGYSVTKGKSGWEQRPRALRAYNSNTAPSRSLLLRGRRLAEWEPSLISDWMLEVPGDWLMQTAAHWAGFTLERLKLAWPRAFDPPITRRCLRIAALHSFFFFFLSPTLLTNLFLRCSQPSRALSLASALASLAAFFIAAVG